MAKHVVGHREVNANHAGVGEKEDAGGPGLRGQGLHTCTRIHKHIV